MVAQYALEPDAASVAVARAYVRDAIGHRADAERVQEVELVVSELVTNSVRHGPGDRPILLRIVADEHGHIAGEVEDQGHGTVAIRKQDADTAAAAGGLGLPIVDSLTSSWGVYPGSTHVWFVFDAA